MNTRLQKATEYLQKKASAQEPLTLTYANIAKLMKQAACGKADCPAGDTKETPKKDAPKEAPKEAPKDKPAVKTFSGPNIKMLHARMTDPARTAKVHKMLSSFHKG